MTIDPPAQQGESRIETLGRFGNFFIALGWHTELAGSITASYHFTERNRTAEPELWFSKPGSDEEARKKFLHLFWVNDGYNLNVDAHSPVVFSLSNEGEVPVTPDFVIRHISDDDFVHLMAALMRINTPEVWTNRMILEITQRFPVKDQRVFHAAAVERVGWQALDAVLRDLHPADHGEEADLGYLDFLCQCVTGLDAGYLPTTLRERFVDTAARLRVTSATRELAHEIVEQLARIDPDLAAEFALSTVAALPHDREELAACLRHCFPRNSQWWIHHTLLNPGLGPDQVADALNCAGTAAAGIGRNQLALLAYEAALIVDPEAQSPAWNTAWLRFERGELEKASACFQRINRHYGNMSLSTEWPCVGTLPWPNASLDPERFTLPAGTTRWPRITVVTPSFNQACYIEETILSVLNQGYPNLQYIVVDGNSNDGTKEVLERYRERISHLIIEPDNGQTEAINKGFRLADGDLVAWLNSDDVYAPGALHAAALKWIETRADVIAGICIEHAGRCMSIFNKPAARNAEFNPPQLARIFKYWLKGYYFYQPEVFFSKSILDSVGLLDESLYYSMDFDLWMRFSKAGAVLEVVDWPFAFFRKHAAQKTTDLVDCVEEQARVRSRHHPVAPHEERLHQIRRALTALARKENPTIGVLTKRRNKIFSDHIQQELDRYCKGATCVLADDERDPRLANADAVILLAHVLEEYKPINYFRSSCRDRLIIAWFWDNHHHLFENHSTAESVDIVLPGHALYGEYLRGDQSIHGGHLPLCVTQWARQDAEAWFDEFGRCDRSSLLYGGFVDYPFEPARTDFLREVMRSIPTHALSILSEARLNDYFGRPEKDRFADWCLYQSSLVLPLRNDLSQRVFDALLAGQIPLVPDEVRDLDLVVPRELQESLPILRFSMRDPSGVARAQQVALAKFADEGYEGVERRHRYALDQHMFSSRINRVLDLLKNIGATNSPATPVPLTGTNPPALAR